MSMIIPLKEINMIEVTSRELPEDMEKGIRDNWSTLLTRYPGMFNGPVFSTVKMENDEGKVTLNCVLSNYAHYKYSEIRDMGEYACRNTYAGCIVVSTDKKFFVSLNGKGSEFVGKIQIIGGVIDPDDRSTGDVKKLSPVVTALRELEEEAGSEIRNSITDVGRSYLVTNGKKYGIHTVVYSDLDSAGIYSAFDSFKKETGNNEIDKMISFSIDAMEELQKYASSKDLEVVNLLRMIMMESR